MVTASLEIFGPPLVRVSLVEGQQPIYLIALSLPRPSYTPPPPPPIQHLRIPCPRFRICFLHLTPPVTQ
jgi:hypothetical protein